MRGNGVFAFRRARSGDGRGYGSAVFGDDFGGGHTGTFPLQPGYGEAPYPVSISLKYLHFLACHDPQDLRCLLIQAKVKL